MTNVTKLDRHLTSAFGIADVKAYLGLQRSDDLNPVYVGIWLAFAECRPESPGLSVCYSFLTLSWKGAPIIKKPVHWFQSIMKKLKGLALFSFLFFFFFKTDFLWTSLPKSRTVSKCNQPISRLCSLSIPPKNVRKLIVTETGDWRGMCQFWLVKIMFHQA